MSNEDGSKSTEVIGVELSLAIKAAHCARDL